MVERAGIVTQAPLDERGIAQPDGDEDVAPRAARDQQPRHVRRVSHQILRRCRTVIDAARVEVGAAVDEKQRHRDGSRAVQRRLAVTTAGVHE